MADDEGKGGRPKGLIPAVLSTMGAIAAIILVIQLIFNPPHRRPRVVCYPAYKTGSFVIVTMPRYILPEDQAFVAKNIGRMDAFYHGCKANLQFLADTPSWRSVVN